MADEKRLVDVNPIIERYSGGEHVKSTAECVYDSFFVSVLKNAPTVDAVEVEKYNALLEMYHDLRENFIDFVCSGIQNVAPYCLNRCDGCCDAYGWCRHSDNCQGFNPAEVIVDCGAKMEGGAVDAEI